MYSLTPGYRVPAIQRGLSPVESMLTKVNAGVGAAVLASAVLTPPPAAAFGAVGVAAALINFAPGRRSVARWATVGFRRLTERTAPASMTTQAGETTTWALYPDHGTMQDPHRRAGFHEAFSRALTFAGSQARAAGIQVHVTHHAATVDGYSVHTQTISVHVPKALGRPDRVLGTLEAEFAALGVLIPVDLDPVPDVVERGPGWAALEDGRYAATARITGWPAEADGDMMPRLLLGTSQERRDGTEFGGQSMSVLYRPLPAGQSRRSARWQTAAAGAFTTDDIKAAEHGIAGATTHGALVQGDALVDVDAYVTVWGDGPESVSAARLETDIRADRYRIALDWLAGQQHRAHVMTSPHGAQTQKGAVL
ncbi:hypothetical protein ACFXPW_33345 [Streptomyces goshikiensis]|uniref:hypothetical protein n=1 Tax=Streptomyces goshikiensis TaxID=1942 RepID=UPI00369E7437